MWDVVVLTQPLCEAEFSVQHRPIMILELTWRVGDVLFPVRGDPTGPIVVTGEALVVTPPPARRRRVSE